MSGPKPRELPIEEIERDYLNGMSTNRLAKKYGMCSETIRKRLISRGVRIRTKSEAMRGNHNVAGRSLSDEHKKKLSVIGRLRTQSPQTREKISASKRGKKRAPFSEEWKRKIGQAGIGRIKTDETRVKLSQSSKRYYQDEKNRQKQSERTKAQWKNPTYRERMSGKNNCMSRPEVRAKVSGKKCWLWKGGVSYEPYCNKFKESLKEEIRAKFGRKCFLCDLPESENGERLSVHHVDYNKSQGCSGLKWGLIALCHDCHTRTSRRRWYYYNMLRDYWVYDYIDFFNF